MATFHQTNHVRQAGYIDNPQSPLHGRLGKLGAVVAGRQRLMLPEGGFVYASPATIQPVDVPESIWKSADGKYSAGDVVQTKLGLAEVIAGPVTTPLGIVYRVRSRNSSREFDEWEHNLTTPSLALASSEDSPDWMFVYYMGKLKLVEWGHNKRYRQILKELLAENGKEVTDDIDATKIVGGTITDGSIEFDGFADPEIRAEAESAISQELSQTDSDEVEAKEKPDVNVDVKDDAAIKIEITLDGWS